MNNESNVFKKTQTMDKKEQDKMKERKGSNQLR
jgi:hypothetical protein